MQSIEKKDGRNEEDNKKVEEEGNERYGGREGGGWHGGLDTPLLPLMGVSTPDTVKKQSSANLWYIFTIWQYGWWESQSERVLHKNVYFYSEVPCAVNTTSGECCRFPFKYKDVSYQDCTKADHHRPWCSLDPVFKGRWGDCGRCDLLFSLKNPSVSWAQNTRYLIRPSYTVPPFFEGMGLWESSNSLGFWYASPMSQGRAWGRGRQAGYNDLFFFHPTSLFALFTSANYGMDRTLWCPSDQVAMRRNNWAIAFAGPKDLPELQSTMPHLALGYATYDDLKNLSQVKKIRRRKIPWNWRKHLNISYASYE